MSDAVEEMVSITKEEYDSLVDCKRTLDALEQGGVDNWEWYSESINMYYPEKWAE